MAAPVLARTAVAALCLVGLYASSHMARKHERAARGELHERSVVTSPRASVGTISNARIGMAYYVLVLVLAPWLGQDNTLVTTVSLIASALAALFSAWLAYSLLFVTRMPCVFCWTGHAVNWALFGLLLWLARTAAGGA